MKTGTTDGTFHAVGISGQYGFNESTLCSLGPESFREIAQMLLGQEQRLPDNPDAWLTAIIFPFLRQVTRSDKLLPMDQVLRTSLIAVAQDARIGIHHDEWETVATDNLASKIRLKYQEQLRQALDKLDVDTQSKLLSEAGVNLRHVLKTMGGPTTVASLLVAGEISGFGVYLATTTTMGALSAAAGVALPWAAYQGVTTALSIFLGPIGWACSGLLLVGSGIKLMARWSDAEERKNAALPA